VRPRSSGTRRRAGSRYGGVAARSAAIVAAALRAVPRPSLPASFSVRRLLRGRGLIALFGIALLGLVFLQVSLLKLNTAISVNVERAAKLERDNAQARASISRLDAGRRVQDAAGQLGMVMPAAGAICFLDARRAGRCSGGDAAEAGRGVDPVAELNAPVTTPSAAGTLAPQQGAGAAPATTTAPAATPGVTTAPATPQAPAQATPQGTATPAQTAPPAGQTQGTAPAQAQGVPAQTGAQTGGLSAAGG
jgi:hypothetical protein